MSKVARAISVVASVVAIVAPFIPGGQIVGAVAAAVSATAGGIAAATAKQKRPGAMGAVNSVIIGANMPIPYAVGRTFVAGAQVYDDSGGTNAGGVQNAVRQQVRILTAAGPIDSYESFLADFVPITFSAGVYGGAVGYYQNVLDNQVRYGARPETAHDYNVTPMPNWGAAYKLSGFASNRIAMWFDKDGERYSGGVPQFGMVGKWVKVYDPRKDSTYPGGSGAHRWNDEGTWEWSENGALHALAYARGRFIEKNADGSAKVPPIKVLGCGFAKEAIELADFVEAANLAETNNWTCGGMVYDGPGISRWDNLKRFCETIAAQPVISGGRLRLKLFAPRPSLFTLGSADVVGDIDLQAMKPFQDRRNSVIYRYRSEAHRWEHVQGEPVTVSTYLAEDGELRSEEVSYDLVQNKDQAAELAAAKLVVDRQFGPLTLACKPRLMRFRPGEAGTINLPEAGLVNQKMVITGRQVDPATGVATLTFESEPTEAEYAFALGQIGTAPPTPVIRSAEEVDQTASDFQPGGGLTDEQLAQIAALQGLVDGSVQFFYSPSEPGIGGGGVTISNLLFENGVDVLAFENGVDLLQFEASGGTEDASEGDIWYNPDTSEWKQLEDGVWVLKSGFGAVGTALIAAASVQGLADGKATIFYADSEPTANGIGDLWIQQSGAARTVKSWNGTSWELLTEIGAQVGSSVVPASSSYPVQTTATGTVKAGQLPRTISASLIRNGAAVTSGVTWSYRVVSGSFNGNTSASGWIAVSGGGDLVLDMTTVGSGGAKIELRAVYLQTTRTEPVDIPIVSDALPSGGGGASGAGSAASISGFAPTTGASDTYGTSDNPLPVVTTGSEGTLAMTANITAALTGIATTASATPYGLFQYRTVGGTWTDAGAEEMGTEVYSYRDLETSTYEQQNGVLTFSRNVTLSPNTSYETRLRLRDSSTVRALAFTGSAGAQGA